MPFKGNRIWGLIIIAFVIILGLTAGIYSAGHKALPTPTPAPVSNGPTIVPPPATVTFTVNSAVGIQSIAVVNQNSGAKMTLIPTELPHTYTVTYGDTLSFKVTAITGYRFNVWLFGDSTFHSPDANGYLIVKITAPLVMDAHFLTDVTG